eukprot:4584400-Lingulodinium_polyedra.AAC.1
MGEVAGAAAVHASHMPARAIKRSLGFHCSGGSRLNRQRSLHRPASAMLADCPTLTAPPRPEGEASTAASRGSHPSRRSARMSGSRPRTSRSSAAAEGQSVTLACLRH